MTVMPVTPESASTSAAAPSGERALPALALIGLLYVLVGTAWLCDDAFITFRTVRNALAGQGLTWNPGERVQAYTHPAWMLLSIAAYSLSGECYFSVLGLAACLTFTAVLMLVYRLREQPLLAAVVVLLLCSSAAFVEYAVCGLENPLLFVLLVLFAAQITRPSAEQRLRHTALLFSAIALTRIDAVLIVGPCCVDLLLCRRDRWAAAREALLGMAPLMLWELFSVVYYGTPVPNTAIAKLNVDLPAEQLFGHGAAYIVDSLRTDPITLTATLACIALLLRSRERRNNAAVLGILLYVVYLLRIGGDFMSGRFCAALLVFALAGAVYTSGLRVVTPVWQRWLLRALLVYAALWPRSPWRVNIDYGAGLGFFDVVLPNGIADERAYYYPTTGLLPVLMLRREIADRKLPLPPFSSALRGSEFARGSAPVAELCMVGFFGYFVGSKHIVDRCALTDPFMARVPFRASQGFRPGHYLRGYPEGYLESVLSGHNLIADPKLAKLYDRVQAVVTGPLFTRTRWQAIWCLNTGGC
jgi:arabinofuranosyltransferase